MTNLMTVAEMRAAGKVFPDFYRDSLKEGYGEPTEKRVIYRHKAKWCKATFAHTYQRRIKYSIEIVRLGNDYDARQKTSSDYNVNGRWLGLDIPSIACPTCLANGRRIEIYGDVVVGRYSDKQKCGARCTSATGSDCECQCGGKNHGADWEAE